MKKTNLIAVALTFLSLSTFASEIQSIECSAKTEYIEVKCPTGSFKRTLSLTSIETAKGAMDVILELPGSETSNEYRYEIAKVGLLNGVLITQQTNKNGSLAFAIKPSKGFKNWRGAEYNFSGQFKHVSASKCVIDTAINCFIH